MSVVNASEAKSKFSRSISNVNHKKAKKKEFTTEIKIQLWDEMTQSYFKNGMFTLSKITAQRDTVMDYISYCQFEFIEFL